MIETANTHRPMNRTLAVIDGGLNSRTGVQMPSTPKPKLLEQVRQAIRTRHYSYMTEKAYVGWIKRFIFSITSGIQRKWLRRKFRSFCQAWQPTRMSALQPKTKLSTPWCFFMAKFFIKSLGLLTVWCAQKDRSGCQSYLRKTRSKE